MAISTNGGSNPTKVLYNGKNVTEVWYQNGPEGTKIKVWPDTKKKIYLNQRHWPKLYGHPYNRIDHQPNWKGLGLKSKTNPNWSQYEQPIEDSFIDKVGPKFERLTVLLKSWKLVAPNGAIVRENDLEFKDTLFDQDGWYDEDSYWVEDKTTISSSNKAYVTSSATTGGTISPVWNNRTLTSTTSQTFTATPASGYKFVKWRITRGTAEGRALLNVYTASYKVNFQYAGTYIIEAVFESTEPGPTPPGPTPPEPTPTPSTTNLTLNTYDGGNYLDYGIKVQHQGAYLNEYGTRSGFIYYYEVGNNNTKTYEVPYMSYGGTNQFMVIVSKKVNGWAISNPTISVNGISYTLEPYKGGTGSYNFQFNPGVEYWELLYETYSGKTEKVVTTLPSTTVPSAISIKMSYVYPGLGAAVTMTVN